jgi:hypothetical protein
MPDTADAALAITNARGVTTAEATVRTTLPAS